MSQIHNPPSIVYWLGEKLYLNITNRCSNDCYFCFRKYKNGIGRFNLRLNAEPSTTELVEKVTSQLHKKHWREIVFCGFGEPFMRLDTILEVTKQLKSMCAVPIRIDTNGQGYLINNKRNVIEELKEAGVNRVSLNADNKETYNCICKPRLEDAFNSVLKFIEEANAYIDTEITAVTVPEVNMSAMEAMARKLGMKLRIRHYEQFFW
jgi:TatD family-associated radical SAM protein